MSKLKGFKQSDDSRCGPTSIKMGLNYYGIEASEDEIAKRANHTYKLGCTNDDAVKAIKSYGIYAEIKQNCTLAQLKRYVNKKIIVIVDWFYETTGHYSIVIKIDNKYIHLMDPIDGKPKKLLIPDFMRVWFDWEKDNILTKDSKMYYQTMIILYKNKR